MLELLDEVSSETDESSEASAEDDIDQADLGQDTDTEANASGPEIFAEDARGRFKPGKNVQIYLQGVPKKMVILSGFEFLTLGGVFLGVKNNSKNFLFYKIFWVV